MEHVPLGATGLSVPRVGLGGAPIGGLFGLELLGTEIPSDLWSDLRREGLLPESAPTP